MFNWIFFVLKIDFKKLTCINGLRYTSISQLLFHKKDSTLKLWLHKDPKHLSFVVYYPVSYNDIAALWDI